MSGSRDIALTNPCEWRWQRRTRIDTTTLFALSDHDILSREWRVIVEQVQNNHHGRPMVL